MRKAMVSSVDEAVGKIIQTLEATGAVSRFIDNSEWTDSKGIENSFEKWQERQWQSMIALKHFWVDICNLKRRPTIEFATFSPTQ